tara:strand:- start:395 stop:658 length:264 start_codon:yes stop_codon:yes gene_type:complete
MEEAEAQSDLQLGWSLSSWYCPFAQASQAVLAALMEEPAVQCKYVKSVNVVESFDVWIMDASPTCGTSFAKLPDTLKSESPSTKISR